MGDIEKQLPNDLFARANVCYLVGLSHVNKIDGDTVTVGKDELKISRPKKKEYIEKIAKYFGSTT